MLQPFSTLAPLIAGFLLCSACSPQDADEESPAATPDGITPPPIVLISIDTLRSDRLSVYGYKEADTRTIDGLAADAILFERAFAHVPLTTPSHATLFTGLLPPGHGVRDNLGYRLETEGIPYLPRILSENGYATGAAVSAYSLRGSAGFSTGFDLYDDEIPRRPRAGLGGLQREGGKTLERAIDWLESVGDRPFFLFLHLFEPHTPHDPPEPFRSRFADPYDGEVAVADRIVGDLLSYLHRHDLYERALILLLSDHGEGLNDHGEDEHGVLLYRESLQVPLLVKLPRSDRGGQRIDTTAGLVDVAPTILSLIGQSPPPEMEGRPLVTEPGDNLFSRPLYAETYYPRLHFGWSELTSIIEGSLHLIDGPDPELYDLELDPGETDNLIATRRHDAERLTLALQPLVRQPHPASDESAVTRQALEALGYVGALAEPRSGALPDPKTRLGTVRDLKDGLRHYSKGNFMAAVEACRRAVDRLPDSLDAWEYLGLSLQQIGQHGEAVAAFRRAFALSGSSHLILAQAQSLIALNDMDGALLLIDSGLRAAGDDLPLSLLAARALAAAGRIDEALERVDAIVREHPNTADAVYLRGAILMGRMELEEAESELRRALRLAPDHTAALSDLAVLLIHRGERDQARQLLERLVRLQPDDPRLRERLQALAASAPD